ncbi:MAG: M23 family metallopeptidase [Gemmatimonadota bacterium]|nr:M23 family metallopeptidase [Gemmatimonadota bacterium]
MRDEGVVRLELLRDRRVWSAFGAGLVGTALVWAFLRSSGGPEPIKVVEIPTPPPPVEVVESLQSGQTLAEVFGTQGLTGGEILEVVEAIREYESPRRLRPGTEITFAVRPGESLSRISLKLDRDRTLHLLASEGDGAPWDARLDSVRIVRDTILVAGLIGSNLYDSRLSGDGPALTAGQLDQMIGQLSRIYAWQIDFWRDIRTNDSYRLVMARDVRPDGSVRIARILAAEFRNGDRLLTAVRFQPDQSEPVEYYDGEGEALRGQFLLAPLDLARVTSGFSMRRFHPVLRRTRPHLGIDYGASRGTPVRATGGGVVTRAGGWGSYGTAIEVRHANNLRTRYAHLSGIARGVRSGARVEQGQVIGFVGSSGLATASHLHYEFLRDGSHVNPARMQFPRAEPVADEYRELFDANSGHALGLLQRVEMPIPSATARTQD